MMGSLQWTASSDERPSNHQQMRYSRARSWHRMRREAPSTQLTSGASAAASEGLKAMIPSAVLCWIMYSPPSPMPDFVRHAW